MFRSPVTFETHPYVGIARIPDGASRARSNGHRRLYGTFPVLINNLVVVVRKLVCYIRGGDGSFGADRREFAWSVSARFPGKNENCLRRSSNLDYVLHIKVGVYELPLWCICSDNIKHATKCPSVPTETPCKFGNFSGNFIRDARAVFVSFLLVKNRLRALVVPKKIF